MLQNLSKLPPLCGGYQSVLPIKILNNNPKIMLALLGHKKCINCPLKNTCLAGKSFTSYICRDTELHALFWIRYTSFYGRLDKWYFTVQAMCLSHKSTS